MAADKTALELPTLPDDFGFEPEHELARQAARRFVNERCPIAEIRKLASLGGAYDPELHRQAAELGWVGLTSSPDLGGAGLGHLHLALLLDELGRVLWPTPLLSCVLALGALERAGSEAQRREHAPAVIAGDRVATIALSEPGGRWLPEQLTTEAAPSEGGFVLRGRKSHVPFGASAELLIVPCREPSGGIGLYLVEPTKGVALEPEVTVDPTRPSARLSLESARVSRAARLEGDGEQVLTQTLLRGAALLSAEMIGAAEAVLEKTRAYAIERQQFGRAIGSFQAVKHPIVDLMMGIELGRSLAFAAAALLDAGGPASERAARMAKAHASDVLSFGVQKGVQLHGGFGFTWDCDVHFYFKRMLVSRAVLGDAVHHRTALGRALFG